MHELNQKFVEPILRGRAAVVIARSHTIGKFAPLGRQIQSAAQRRRKQIDPGRLAERKIQSKGFAVGLGAMPISARHK